MLLGFLMSCAADFCAPLCLDRQNQAARMSKEEELAVANKLVSDWKQAVEGSLPAGSIVRLQLDKALGDATERLAKVLPEPAVPHSLHGVVFVR